MAVKPLHESLRFGVRDAHIFRNRRLPLLHNRSLRIRIRLGHFQVPILIESVAVERVIATCPATSRIAATAAVKSVWFW
jgi:hypothetical protein